MDDLIEVCVGKRYRVSMTRAVSKQFNKVDAALRARCQKWMSFYAEDGGEFLDEQKFKHEGKFPVGDKAGTKAAIWTFKAGHVRVYGGHIGDTFIATEIDPAKKKPGADQDLLKSAAKKLKDYL